ncbi:hypothetical protein [uncultured Tateyamaria sp.]|uniref:hypothetical protein n=1 Tax=uncultured Tateyamaria sp. TaxID=455651 RepID=UPI002618127A|nr:hypothetical protein [uncultured Tateyamaria sp.]
MSAPDTNIEKQARRHHPALIGIAVATAAVFVFILAAQMAPEDDATPALTTATTQSE